ncbi:hypothetical protein LMH87_006751 [Akanthomyces muscarius]|uniref:Uncharacterized protein n=1 Tax=Akanthomyces muscarius TaxID=2231603 RepID=A0A9W8QNW9_AKAMU|nr:hypothetical protein LMH87_006751 [Akanthomyces muscarius]KAJ4165104.1 hypothetical protein LMH87_006751 [Akanthomyces muscarius]
MRTTASFTRIKPFSLCSVLQNPIAPSPHRRLPLLYKAHTAKRQHQRPAAATAPHIGPTLQSPASLLLRGYRFHCQHLAPVIDLCRASSQGKPHDLRRPWLESHATHVTIAAPNCLQHPKLNIQISLLAVPPGNAMSSIVSSSSPRYL